MNWFVLYVKSNTEKKVASTLAKLELETYAPHVTEIRQWSDRKKKVDVPLFKSYVFVKLEETQRNRVFDVPGVVRYLFWLGKPARVRDREIDVIKDWIDNDAVENLVLSQFATGDHVMIKRGPLKDKEAIIEHIDTTNVRLTLLDMGVVVCAKINKVLQ